jgi:hypothetical protein
MVQDLLVKAREPGGAWETVHPQPSSSRRVSSLQETRRCTAGVLVSGEDAVRTGEDLEDAVGDGRIR